MTTITCGPLDRAIADRIEENDTSHNFFRKSGKTYQVVVDVSDLQGEVAFLTFADRLRQTGSGVFSPKFQASFAEIQKIADRFRSDDFEIEAPLSEARWAQIGQMDKTGLVATSTGRKVEVDGEQIPVVLFRIDLGRYFANGQVAYRDEVNQILRRVRWYYEDALTEGNRSVDDLPIDLANFVAFSQFPDIRFDIPLSAQRVADLRGFDPESRFVTASSRPVESGSEYQVMRLTVNAAVLSTDESYRRSLYLFVSQARTYYESLMKDSGHVPSDLDLDLRNFYAILRSFASLDPAVTPVAERPADLRALFRDYLTAHYGGMDEVASNAFVREELEPVRSTISFTPRTDFLGHDRDSQKFNFDIWLQKVPTPLKGLTLDDLLTFLSAAAPTGAVVQGGPGSTTQSVTTTVLVHVGDGQATVGENTEQTARFARTLDPIGEESVVLYPTDADLPRTIRLQFESVNWTRPTDLTAVHGDPTTFIRPCMVHIVPSSYNGALPPEEADRREWHARNGRESIDDPAPYFMTLYPRRMGSTGTEDLLVGLPATRLPFKVVVQAGSRSADKDHLYRLHPNDPYDNFDVTVVATNLRLAPGVSESKANTIVLGEEYDRVTEVEHGRVVPAEGIAPDTENSNISNFPRLSPSTYALYHPRVRDPKADFSRDKRTVAVKRGSNYLFEPIMSGIDDSYAFSHLTPADIETSFSDRDQKRDLLAHQPHLRIVNGSHEVVFIISRDYVVTVSDGRVVAREIYDPYHLSDFMRERVGSVGEQTVSQLSSWNYRQASIYTRWVPIPNGSGEWLAEQAISTNDSSVVVEVNEPDETWTGVKSRHWIKYVVEKDTRNRWFVSSWRKEDLPSGGGRFRLVTRRESPDEFDARQVIEAHKFGSIKRIRHTLEAETDRIEIHAASRTRNVWHDPHYSGFTGSCDEIRVDEVGLRPVD